MNSSRAHRGFSLIEVLVAVVILSTGLLALAALQGSLTKASADAKVRTQVASLLQGHLDQIRTTGYPAPGTVTDTCATNAGGDFVPTAFCTQNGLAGMSVTRTITRFTSPAGGAFASPGNATDPAQFARVTLAATWTDANGATNRRLAMTSDISALALEDEIIVPPDDSGQGGQSPIVRQLTPATAGVIPIAMGGNDATAATNPKPELVGQRNNQKVVSTNFNVLTYTNEGSNIVRVQRRIENSLVKCSCQYGAGGTNLPLIFRAPQWPAIWTGDAYEVYKPDPAATAPGATLANPAGPTPGVDQSALCQECCRDHHDVASNLVKFDPERTTNGVSKYRRDNSNALVTVNPTNNQTYLNACRVIRVDGFWRTAADTYQRQFGLLETETVNLGQARTGLPTATATTAYTGFVRDYLKQYNGTFASGPPISADTMFNTPSRGLNNPSTVLIASVSATDYRYLHGRGLYVDYLEAKARQRLQDVLADTGQRGRCPQTPTATPIEECILPYLPFTTVNLTEIAQWLASDTTVLTVNSRNLLATNPAQPSGSRTIGRKIGTSDNTGSARKSNSGIAIIASVDRNQELIDLQVGGVDPTDDSDIASDVQPFLVGGIVTTKDSFDVRVSGGGLAPRVFYSLNLDVGECLKPANSDHRCVTNSILPLGGSIRLENYWIETTTTLSRTTTCLFNGSPRTATDTIPVPTFRNYAVTSVTRNGSAFGTIGAAANDGKTSETTTITFGSVGANDLLVATLTEQAGSPTYATIASCTTNGGGNQINNIVWTKPWTLP
ncbi:prepilin-type N-terminal cleavage/methylation domain-containing protein [Luteimonas vadosa]